MSAGPSPPVPDPRPVQRVEILQRQGGRVAWSVQGDRLAFDRVGADGRYDLYVMHVDGTGERCLTCGALEFKRTNNLNPAWHPSGEYLVFQVQQRPKRLGLSARDLVTPHRALHSELWLIRRDGRRFWPLTRVRERGGAVLDPHFSHEGSELLWSERVSTRRGRWGEWVLRVADFQIKRNPRLSKVRSYSPGEQRGFLVSQGFTPNDQGAIVSGSLEMGQSELGLDVYLLDFKSGELTRLTHSGRSWDEHARFSPRGERIAWTTDSEISAAPGTSQLSPARPGDLWIMEADGSSKRRLTFFNHPSSAESLGMAYVGDFDWSPRGDRIAIHVLSGPQSHAETIYLIHLDESYRR